VIKDNLTDQDLDPLLHVTHECYLLTQSCMPGLWESDHYTRMLEAPIQLENVCWSHDQYLVKWAQYFHATRSYKWIA